jgi:predicted acylesterase/phospholipase RssA
MNPNFPFENLVFEGGGCKGTVYAGALEEVERRGGYKHIKRVAGASAGSFIATYIAIGMTVAEVRQELLDIDFDYLSSDPAGAAGLFKNLKRLKCDFGLHTGYAFSLHMPTNFFMHTHSPDGFVVIQVQQSLIFSHSLSPSFFLILPPKNRLFK